MLGVLFALLVVACGLAVNRALRVSPSLAPLSGVASVAVLTTWCAALGAPPLVSAGLLLVLGLCGVAPSPSGRGEFQRWPLLVVASAMAVPAVLLGGALAGVEAPVSTHDGAFHVETIDSLRRGLPAQTWYPLGFHTSVAAFLALVPWIDSARGVAEVAEGLAVLAPLAVFSLGLALGLDARIAAIGAGIQALTFIYPYDYHLWAGWPQGMGVLLVLGVWMAALQWTQRPSLRLALVGGLLGAAIVLTHGTDVYSAGLGLLVIGVARRGRLDPKRLAGHVPLALGLAIVLAAPYLPTLLHWMGGGGATAVAESTADYFAAHPEMDGHADWLQFGLGVTGAASTMDLPVRLALVALGLRLRTARLATALWVTFLALLLLVDFADLPVVNRLFVATYPWLVDHRPRQIAVVFASLLAAGGIGVGAAYVGQWRGRLARHPHAWRRLAIACALVMVFFAEGSAVSVYKRLVQTVAEQGVYSMDDGAAMAWLKQHVQPGEVVANDRAVDAGIWAPYKANVAILLPRSASLPQLRAREPILEHVVDLSGAPRAHAEACALGVGYLYYGGRALPFDERAIPDRASLEGAADLEQVFSSGQAAIFRIHLNCS